MIVSRFTLFIENLVTCCYQVTKIFCTRYGSAIASSARGRCNFGPLTGLAISVFREVSFNTVLTRILTSLRMWALKILHEKNWRVSLSVQELCHPPKFPSILAATPVCQNTTGRLVLSSWFSFLFGFGFLVGLLNGSPRSVRSTCELDTSAG